jgi:hypothetical protein
MQQCYMPRGRRNNKFKFASKTRSRPVQRWKKSMEVLNLGVVQGVQACNLGVTLPAEELERDAAAKANSRKPAIFSL